MKSFATTIAIDAPAARVWALLTDAVGYAAWNSTVGRIDGRIAASELITKSIPHLQPSFDRFAADLQPAAEPAG